MNELRVAVRRSRAPQSAWQDELIARVRAVPGLEIVATASADVVVDLTESASPAGPSHLHPPLGTWRFVYGAEGRIADPGLHELLRGERGVMIRLVSFAQDGSATLLEAGVFKAVAHSLGATRARLFEAAAEWPARVLRRVLAGEAPDRLGPVSVEASTSVDDAGGTRRSLLNPLFRTSSGAALAIRAHGLARRLAQELTEEHWTLGVIRKPIHHVIDAFDPEAIEWLPPPPGGVLADPAGAIEHDGRITVLAEAYEFENRRGRIVALDIAGGCIVSEARDVLVLPVHASYPHLIVHGGHIYCLPETSAAGCLQLYRADPFPDRWVPDRILLHGFAGTDATVHRYGSHWWLFAGNHDDQDETKLYVFHATDLFGPWQPHPLNPVKCDLRSARPAGALFEHEGELYRPAQDCSSVYGGAVAINRVLSLSTTDFAEETVNVLLPARSSPWRDGLHTVTGVGGLTLVDGKRHARSFKRLAWGLKQLARKRAGSSVSERRGRGA